MGSPQERGVLGFAPADVHGHPGIPAFVICLTCRSLLRNDSSDMQKHALWHAQIEQPVIRRDLEDLLSNLEDG